MIHAGRRSHACPCGYCGDAERPCPCTPLKVRSYRSRVSGPLLDRIDIHIEVPRVPYRELSSDAGGEPSGDVRGRVNRARGRSSARVSGGGRSSATPTWVRGTSPGIAGWEKRKRSSWRRRWSGLPSRPARITGRIKVARTIADLAGEENISTPHLAEAIQYRSLDREVWA